MHSTGCGQHASDALFASRYQLCDYLESWGHQVRRARAYRLRTRLISILTFLGFGTAPPHQFHASSPGGMVHIPHSISITFYFAIGHCCYSMCLIYRLSQVYLRKKKRKKERKTKKNFPNLQNSTSTFQVQYYAEVQS